MPIVGERRAGEMNSLADEIENLVRLRRDASGLVEEYLGECRFVKLRGSYGWDES